MSKTEPGVPGQAACAIETDAQWSWVSPKARRTFFADGSRSSVPDTRWHVINEADLIFSSSQLAE